MRRILCLGAVLSLIVLAIAGCKSTANKYVAPPPPKVTVCQPVVQQVTDYADYTGNTSAIETVELRARVEGYLQKINFQAGSVIKKDALLFLIDPKPFELAVQQAQAELDARKAQVTLAEATLRQYEDAIKKGAATEFEVLTATGKRDAAKAAVLSAVAALEKAKLDLGYTQVRSPFDGWIDRSQVDEGNLVGASGPTVLATVVRFDPIYAYFSISENDLLEYLNGKGARNTTTATAAPALPIFLGLSNETSFPHEGRLESTGNQIDLATGTIPIRGVFTNAARKILPGSFVRVRLMMGKVQAMLVPDIAIASDQGGQYVFVVNQQNVVEMRRIVPGKLYGSLRDIRHGLSEKDWVIATGLQRARPGAAVEPIRQTAVAVVAASESQPASAATKGAPKKAGQP